MSYVHSLKVTAENVQSFKKIKKIKSNNNFAIVSKKVAALPNNMLLAPFLT